MTLEQNTIGFDADYPLHSQMNLDKLLKLSELWFYILNECDDIASYNYLQDYKRQYENTYPRI